MYRDDAHHSKDSLDSLEKKMLTPEQQKTIQNKARRGAGFWALGAATLVAVIGAGLFYAGYLPVIAAAVVLGIPALPLLGVLAGLAVIAFSFIGYRFNKAKATRLEEKAHVIIQKDIDACPSTAELQDWKLKRDDVTHDSKAREEFQSAGLDYDEAMKTRVWPAYNNKLEALKKAEAAELAIVSVQAEIQACSSTDQLQVVKRAWNDEAYPAKVKFRQAISAAGLTYSEVMQSKIQPIYKNRRDTLETAEAAIANSAPPFWPISMLKEANVRFQSAKAYVVANTPKTVGEAKPIAMKAAWNVFFAPALFMLGATSEKEWKTALDNTELLLKKRKRGWLARFVPTAFFTLRPPLNQAEVETIGVTRHVYACQNVEELDAFLAAWEDGSHPDKSRYLQAMEAFSHSQPDKTLAVLIKEYFDRILSPYIDKKRAELTAATLEPIPAVMNAQEVAEAKVVEAEVADDCDLKETRDDKQAPSEIVIDFKKAMLAAGWSDQQIKDKVRESFRPPLAAGCQTFQQAAEADRDLQASCSEMLEKIEACSSMAELQAFKEEYDDFRSIFVQELESIGRIYDRIMDTKIWPAYNKKLKTLQKAEPLWLHAWDIATASVLERSTKAVADAKLIASNLVWNTLFAATVFTGPKTEQEWDATVNQGKLQILFAAESMGNKSEPVAAPVSNTFTEDRTTRLRLEID